MNEVDTRALFVAHQVALRKFVRRLVPKAVDAEEIMQDLAVVVFAHRRGPPDEESFVSWCCVVARNLVAHRRRGEARRRSRYASSDSEPPPSSSPHDPESTAVLRELLVERLGELDAPGRRLFLRRFLLEYTPAEMAARTHVSASSLRMRVARIVAVLRALERKSTERDEIVGCARDRSGN